MARPGLNPPMRLISHSSRGVTIAVDAYLAEIARNISASLLGKASGITIEVRAEALDMDPDRAVPFGLLVNELATNAIRHAFPGGTAQDFAETIQFHEQRREISERARPPAKGVAPIR